MNDDQTDRLEHGIIASLAKRAQEGNASAGRAVLSHIATRRGRTNQFDMFRQTEVDGEVIAEMTREEYLVTSLRDAEQTYLSASNCSSHQAAVAAKRLAVNIRAELDELRRAVAEGAVEETMTDDELIQVVLEAVAGLAPRHFLQVAEAVDARRGHPALRVVEGQE